MNTSLKIRPGKLSDYAALITWLQEKEILRWFPMSNLPEIEDAARLWISYAQIGALLAAEEKGEPVALANLYLQPYEKFRHHALFAIIVKKEMRGKGIGTLLVKELMQLAKKKFKLELLLLEVYEKNPAKRLYERLGFEVYGFHKNFIKEEDGSYLGKYFMQKRL